MNSKHNTLNSIFLYIQNLYTQTLYCLLLVALLAAPRAHAQIEDVPEAYDKFGRAVAVGDFNGDGEDDLAIGVPEEDVGSIVNAGAVNVLYGSSGIGLTSTGDQIWHQDTPGVEGACEEDDNFGYSLSSGDFDNDGFDDLAIGVPEEYIGSIITPGAVHVLYGSSGGLTATGNQIWHQDAPGVEGVCEANDHFGWSLASGDFDSDGFDDLAIGVPGEDIGSISSAGVVHVLYGSSGVGLTATGDQIWHQDAPGVVDACEEGDDFGYSLASGDFDNDGFDDLAIGVPYEEVGSIFIAGAVHVLYGSSGVGLTATGDQIWHQDTPGVVDACEELDYFGWSLASGDFDSDGFDDLAIGVHYEDIGSIQEAGAVNVLYGSSGVGLTATGDQIWHQDAAGVEGECEGDDNFGNSLASGDFDGDGFDDLAIGVRQEEVGSIALAGAVNVLYGSSGVGLTATGDQIWHQDATGIVDLCEELDVFGHSLSSGDFDNDGFDDLAIGVPNEDYGSIDEAGAVNVLYGSSGVGLTATGDQIWNQASSLAGRDAASSTYGIETPAQTTLHQAWPNPFTNNATIVYEVAERGSIRLTVYDLFGREVAILADGVVEAGRYKAVLDGASLPSGVYLMQMTSERGFEQTCRVIRVE